MDNVMTIGMRKPVRIAGLLMIAFFIAGLAGCGSGGAKKEIETDASTGADPVAGDTDVT